MTKRDYETIAGALRTIAARTRPQVARVLAEVCERDNPRFDRSRFFAACALREVFAMGDGTICTTEKEGRDYANGIARRTSPPVIISMVSLIKAVKVTE